LTCFFASRPLDIPFAPSPCQFRPIVQPIEQRRGKRPLQV
jgi:hypothetical protein